MVKSALTSLAVLAGAVAFATTPLSTDSATPTPEATSQPLVAQNNQPGSFTGKVLDSQGQPAEGVLVKLYTLTISQGGGGQSGRGMSADLVDDAEGPVPLMQNRQRRGPKPTAVQKTDSQGKFTFPKLKPQFYRYIVGDRRAAAGYAAGSFTLKAGEKKEEEIKLQSLSDANRERNGGGSR